MPLNFIQHADHIQSQQHSRYENETHIISKRQTIPAQRSSITPPPCVYNEPLPHEYAVRTIFKPIFVYDKPDAPLLTAQEDPQLDINTPIWENYVKTQHDKDSLHRPVYTLEISDPAQLSDPDFWTDFFSEEFNLDQLNHGNKTIIVEVDPGDAFDSDEGTIPAESSNLKTTNAEFRTAITEYASRMPKLKLTSDTVVIEDLEQINEKQDQNSDSGDGACVAEDDDCEDAYDCDEMTEIPKEDGNDPTTEIYQDPSSSSERSNKIRRALAALLRTVHDLQSRDNNEIIQMFRDHHSPARPSI